MKKQVMHLLIRVVPSSNPIALCGKPVRTKTTTININEVTCKNCRRTIDNRLNEQE